MGDLSARPAPPPNLPAPRAAAAESLPPREMKVAANPHRDGGFIAMRSIISKRGHAKQQACVLVTQWAEKLFYTCLTLSKHLYTCVNKHLLHTTFPHRGSQRTSPSFCLPHLRALASPSSILPFLFAIWYPSKAVRP